jgi:glycerophosphoryl diester phosphodiesterase
MDFYKVGHRGTRGLMPENTIPAMIKGIAAGANTIEFDVHITKDGQVVVYHDDSLDPAYTTMPDGSEIADREQYALHKMDYSQIRRFIIGEKAYPEFPEQQRLKSYAPLLSELINAVETYKAGIYYLLEIKSSDYISADEYIDKLMAVKELHQLGDRLIVQSFDMRPLQVMHRKYPFISPGLLSEQEDAVPDQQLAELGFSPAFYNPYYSFLTPELLQQCHAKHIQVVPWTVQEIADMKKLKEMGVDGIITDYPDRFKDAGL